MKVALIDVDIEKGRTRKRHPFPNLALMKLSAYYKRKGDQVRLNYMFDEPDIVYASCVFTWHRKRLAEVPVDAHTGGPGLMATAQLPDEIEHIMPDYDLYAGVDYSMGFTSRGCIRKCPWCKVPKFEGWIKAWAHFREFWDQRHRTIKLLDNNLLAAPNWRETLADLAKSRLKVDFNQGLDIRLVNDENAWYLKQVKLVDTVRFAFDDISYEKSVREGIALLLKSGFRPRQLSFYFLVGFPGDQSALERLKLLGSFGVEVYPMVYRDDSGVEPKVNLGEVPDIFWHGDRGNINRFLRVVGRLPW